MKVISLRLRDRTGGRVLQSYLPEHYAIQAAAHHDYETFYRQEIAYRREQFYPPFRRLARIEFRFPTANLAEYEAQRARQMLEQRITEGQFTATEIIGPTPCFFARRNNLFRWHLIVRSANPAALLAGLDEPTSGRVQLAGNELTTHDEDGRAAVRACRPRRGRAGGARPRGAGKGDRWG